MKAFCERTRGTESDPGAKRVREQKSERRRRERRGVGHSKGIEGERKKEIM